MTAARLPAGAWKSTARQDAWRLRRPVPAMTAPRRKVDTIRTGPNLARIWLSVDLTEDGRQDVDVCAEEAVAPAKRTNVRANAPAASRSAADTQDMSNPRCLCTRVPGPRWPRAIVDNRSKADARGCKPLKSGKNRELHG